MHKNRLEAFRDGVIAILITIMVLELKVPHGTGFEDLKPLIPVFCSYSLSFIYLAIYWNNHHHLFQVTQKVSGKILWANMNLLFWLSLFPFGTAWLAENRLEFAPVAFYGGVLAMAGFAYYILSQTLISEHGSSSSIAKAIGSDFKGKLSVVIYGIAITTAFWNTFIALTLYVVVAIIWLIPDRRIEKVVQ